MQWNRSNTIGLARESCCYCHGDGLRLVHRGKAVPCHCVFRAIFRTCYNRFRYCVEHGPHIGNVFLDFCPGKDCRRAYSRKREDFVADFCLVSRRTLDDEQYRVFRYHFLLGADWRLCCRQLHIDKGNFFHLVYEIEQHLGRIFAELEPYSLYPVDEYFSGPIHEPAAPVLKDLFRPKPKRRLFYFPLAA